MPENGLKTQVMVTFILLHSTDIHCQILPQQSEAQLVRPESSVKVSCKVSGYNFIEYYMEWVKQKPRQGVDGANKS